MQFKSTGHDDTQPRIPSVNEDLSSIVDFEDDISEMLSTHRPNFNSDFSPSLRESIAEAVRHSLELQPQNPSFTVADNLEQLLGTEKFQRLMKNLEDIEDVEDLSARAASKKDDASLKSLQKSLEPQPHKVIIHSEDEALLRSSSHQRNKDKSDDALLSHDVKCAYSSEQIYAQAQQINLQALKNASLHEPDNHAIFSDRLSKANSDQIFASHRRQCLPEQRPSVPFNDDSRSTNPGPKPCTAINSKTHPQVVEPIKEASNAMFAPSRREFTHQGRSLIGPIPKASTDSQATIKSSDSMDSLSVFNSGEIQLAKKSKVPQLYVPSLSIEASMEVSPRRPEIVERESCDEEMSVSIQ